MRKSIFQVALSLYLSALLCEAFSPAQRRSLLPFSGLRSTATPTARQAAAVPNPFKNLPWNVRKEQQRQARRLAQERARLHRELGIAEDASYEEIVEATDRLIARAGGDIKQKIKIEVAKDKILQIRLNERLAGLTATTKEARAQSQFEVEG